MGGINSGWVIFDCSAKGCSRLKALRAFCEYGFGNGGVRRAVLTGEARCFQGIADWAVAIGLRVSSVSLFGLG
jgi:hypothetical protein